MSTRVPQIEFGEIAVTAGWDTFSIPLGVSSIAFQNRSGSGVTVRMNNTNSDTGAWTLFDGDKESIEEPLLGNYTLYFKTTSGTVTIYYRAIKFA